MSPGSTRYDDCHIDLGPLARFAGARLYHAEVEGLDLTNRRVHVRGRPPVAFDLLSINAGSRPRTLDVPGAAEHALAVKPIDAFLEHWEALTARVAGEHRAASASAWSAAARAASSLPCPHSTGCASCSVARGDDPQSRPLHAADSRPGDPADPQPRRARALPSACSPSAASICGPTTPSSR